MLHPSYSDLMNVVNSNGEPGEAPVVNSRYSIVMAAAKRARQLIDGQEALVPEKSNKPLSVAIEELNQGKIKILPEEDPSAEGGEISFAEEADVSSQDEAQEPAQVEVPEVAAQVAQDATPDTVDMAGDEVPEQAE